MSRQFNVEGIVLKESPLGENGKLLIVFTKELGRISVAAKGVKKPGSSLVQLSQLFSYCKFELYKGNSSLYTLTGGVLIEPFVGLGEDYDRISAASSMSVNLLKVIQEDLCDEDTLRLFLNSLHFISTGKRKPEFVKAVFLLRMLQYQGVVPEVYDIERQWGSGLENGTLSALEHIFDSEITELFSFGVSDNVLDDLIGIAKMLLTEID